MTEYVATCDIANIQQDGTCSVLVWTEKPLPTLPPLTVEEGFLIASAIAACWGVAIAGKIILRFGRTEAET